MSTVDRALMHANAGPRLAILLASYHRLTGEQLGTGEESLWQCPLAVVAHDTASPPAFFYANHAALTLFKSSARAFIGLPSAQSAAPAQRPERAAMLARLEEHDIVTGYSGIRTAADGTAFLISDAVIWNLTDAAGARHGQAAAIAAWDYLG